MWNYTEMRFTKSGADIKAAIAHRVADLETRLRKRHAVLDQFISDRERLRSYLVRDTDNDYPQPSQTRRDMPSEEHEEITELCRRICRIEKELHQLKLAQSHLKDDQEVELSFEDLTFFGFDAS